MDSRTKILDLAQAGDAARRLEQAGRRVTLVTGYFDPVLASHARVLEGAAGDGSSVFVAVGDPPDPLLPARARAELVAALACVAAVTVAGREAAAAAIRPARLVHQEADDSRRTRELIEHVQSRQIGR